jgi:hypothetical protein
VDRAPGFPGDPPLLPRGPLQGAIWGRAEIALRQLVGAITFIALDGVKVITLIQYLFDAP